ncbi:BTB/POZ protein [Jimgerdemannia flammicorona]|uniref:BTB/POZ protein n=1 Tax=Jimgerdemannia flammicorona TaxID=994334 RepID=A0A433D3K7_9FUNG|nr:BTB/POZ protein [Jimgerdemannia flammicorona]
MINNITFNVNGRRWQTTRETVSNYPGTVLYRLINDPRFVGQELTINRDGDLFKYVLGFYRNKGVICVPPCVGGATVQNELVAYGFDGNKIVVTLENEHRLATVFLAP